LRALSSAVGARGLPRPSAAISNVKYPHLVSLDLIINLVRIPHDRQLEYSGLAGFGRHEWKVREPGDATLDQVLD